MDTIRRILKSTKQTDNPRMLVRVEAVEKMLKDYGELVAMMVAFRHAANSIGKAADITKDHIAHDEAEASVCGDAYYLALIRGAEELIKLQSIQQKRLLAMANEALSNG
jgi:hypothetical protein